MTNNNSTSLNTTDDGICYDISELFSEDPTGSVYSKVIFGFLYGCVFIFGLVGNGAVMYVTATNQSLITVQNIFILNLTVADIVVCLLSVPVTPITNIYKRWYFGTFLCYLIPWVQGFSIFILTFTLAAIAINRYILILHPHRSPIQKKACLMVIAMIWLGALTITFPYSYYMKIEQVILFGKVYCGVFCQENWPSQEPSRRVFTFAVAAAQFIIPSIIIVFCYCAILVRLRRRTNEKLSLLRQHKPHAHHLFRRNQQPTQQQQAAAMIEVVVEAPTDNSPSAFSSALASDPNTGRRQQLITGQRRTTRVLVCMVSIFILSWLPYQFVQLIIEFYPRNPLQFFFSTVTHWIAMTGILANPILYAWLNTTFREIILKRCRTTDKRSTVRGRHLLRDEAPPTTTMAATTFAHSDTTRLNTKPKECYENNYLILQGNNTIDTHTTSVSKSITTST